jgi:hypothetical protein
MTPRNILRTALSPLLRLLAVAGLAACSGVETGALSPCHGQFRAEGKYFSTHMQSDGSRVVVSTMSAADSSPCGN